MEKQRTHLTPEEVQEFINLGVDFGETELVWRVNAFGVDNCNPKLLLYTEQLPEVMLLPNEGYIPAPNLQEVLEVLPKVIVRNDPYGEEREYDLSLWYITNSSRWGIAYEDLGVMFIDESVFYNSNPIDAAANLLRWLCKNHPETLKKDDNKG